MKNKDKENGKRSSAKDLIEALPFGEQPGKDPYNASEVVALRDSRFLFCDNNISDSLFEIRLTPEGKLACPLIRHPIRGVSPRYLDDFEGMALAEDGDRHFLIVTTSLSLKINKDKINGKKSERGKESIERESLLRITITGNVRPQAEIIPGFRSWLIENAPELGDSWRYIPDDGGLNIEGLAWNPKTCELLFGVRTPVFNKMPLILRVKVKDIAGMWNFNDFEMLPPVFLRLANSEYEQGIRTMEYDPSRGTTLIVVGKTTSSSKTPFELYEWDGNLDGIVRRFDNARFHPKFRVEGVTHGSIGGRGALVFVDDRGGYRVVWDDDPRLK